MQKLRVFKRITAIVLFFTFFVSITCAGAVPTITTSFTYEHQRAQEIEHNGLLWEVDTTCTKVANRTSDNGTPNNTEDDGVVAGPPEKTEVIGGINESGNLMLDLIDKPNAEYNTYYLMSLNSLNNDGTMFHKNAFDTATNLEVKLKFADRFQFICTAGKYKYNLDIYNDSKLRYTVEDGSFKAIEADIPENVWNTFNFITNPDTGMGTICINGKELVTYKLPKGNGWPNLAIRLYAHTEYKYSALRKDFKLPGAFVEMEYLTLTPVAASTNTLTLTGVYDGEVLNVGDSRTLKTSASADGNLLSSAKVASYYINGVYGQDKVTNSLFSKTNNGYTHTFNDAGVYRIYGMYNNNKTDVATVTVVDSKSVNIAVPEVVGYGETVTVAVDATGLSNVSGYEFYVNGERQVASASANATLSGLRAGTAAINAKVLCADGFEYMTDTKYVDVNKGVVTSGETVEMSREYQLDYYYNGANGSSVNVDDGYFELNFEYDDNKIYYKDNDGNTKTYTGVGNGIKQGNYSVVVTSGNAEVYYNGHFLFSCLLQYTKTDTQGIVYTGGITDVTLNSSGVKAERFFKEWTTDGAVEEYDFDMNLYYSAEFDKSNSEAETIVVYDGEYQAKLIFDERGITAIAQDEDYELQEDFNLANSFETGYYRLTVARGLAQLFVNNNYINSFKCPFLPHAKSVMRSNVESEQPRMISIKNTDDVYYHTEDFEGNTEYSSLEYWFSEMEGEALEEGEVDKFTQEIVNEGDNKYLKISDKGLEKEYYADAAAEATADASAEDGGQVEVSQPIGDWTMNATPDNPIFNWRAKAEGTGEIHFIARHYQKGYFLSVSFSFTDSCWYVNRYNLKKREIELSVDQGKENIDGNTNIRAIYYIEREEPLAVASDNQLDTEWHQYEMQLVDDYIALYLDGEKVIEYTGLFKGHGRMGFGVAYGASLLIDDVEYAGSCKVSPGVRFLSLGESADATYQGIVPGTEKRITASTAFEFGTRNFYKSDTWGIVAGTENYFTYHSDDGGRTWKKCLDSGGHYNAVYPGYRRLNLLSGGLMAVHSANWGLSVQEDPYLKIPVKDKYLGSYYNRVSFYPISDSIAGNRFLNGVWATNDILIDPVEAKDYDDGSMLKLAMIPTQVLSGKYKGRIFLPVVFGGERYGSGEVYYTDVDKKFVDGEEKLSDYWNEETGYNTQKLLVDEWKVAETSLGYGVVDFEIDDMKIVDLPDDVLRMYCRGNRGFLYYLESFDGGDTWSKALPTNFISPRGNFGIAHDPDNLDAYYIAWQYDVSTCDKQNDGGRPRTRTALAASFDGMKTWQYIADLDELTDDWKYNHDGKTTLSTQQNHNLKVLDGVVYVGYDGNGLGYGKMYSLNTAMVKPLMRFSEAHDKTLEYTDGAGLLFKRVSVLPKETGRGSIYGKGIDVTVTDGICDASVLALAVCCAENEVSGLSVPEAAAVGGMNVVETKDAYIVSNTDISRVSAYYLEGLGVEKTFEDDLRDSFLNRFNTAAEYGQTEKMAELLYTYSDAVGLTVDPSDADVIEKMSKFSYYSIEDIGNIYSMLCTISEGADTALVLSTVADGFESWATVSEDGSADLVAEADTVSLTAKTAYTTRSEYGTAKFEIPDCDIYALNFDIKVGNNEETAVKWGNAEHEIELAINSGTDYNERQDRVPVTATADKWYNFIVAVQKSGAEWNVTVRKAEIASDGTVGEYTEEVFSDVTGTNGRYGFWLEVTGGTAQLRKVRLYSDTVVEVLSFSANNGKAQAEVEILNLETSLDSAELVMNLFNGNASAGIIDSDELEEPIPAFGTKKISLSADYDVKTGINPAVKFHLWKDTLNMQPIAEPIIGATKD